MDFSTLYFPGDAVTKAGKAVFGNIIWVNNTMFDEEALYKLKHCQLMSKEKALAAEHRE